MRRFVRYLFAGTIVIAWWTLGARPALAQVSTTRVLRWELEGYGGFASAGISLTGSSTLPPQGPTLTTSSVLFPTHQTSSWFFGDGAATLNNAAADFGLSAAIVPLDDALNGVGLSSGRASFGVRARRLFAPRLAAEFGLDVTTSGDLSGDFTQAIEDARTSFTSTFGSILATGPFTGVVVNAVGTRTPGSSREVSLTGALRLYLSSSRAFYPYVTIGGGLISVSGRTPSVTLEGDYRFAVLNDVPIHETDRVTLRYVQSSAPLMVAGGGVSRNISGRWGWQVDGRVLLSGPVNKLVLDATPTIASGAPAGVVESLTNPNLQFSNSASTGRSSTLGGAPLQGFVVFDEGLRTRFIVSIGIFRRF